MKAMLKLSGRGVLSHHTLLSLQTTLPGRNSFATRPYLLQRFLKRILIERRLLIFSLSLYNFEYMQSFLFYDVLIFKSLSITHQLIYLNISPADICHLIKKLLSCRHVSTIIPTILPPCDFFQSSNLSQVHQISSFWRFPS